MLLDLTQVTRLHGFDPVWLVLVVGAVTFILGFAGCVGALRENICLLKFVSSSALRRYDNNCFALPLQLYVREITNVTFYTEQYYI